MMKNYMIIAASLTVAAVMCGCGEKKDAKVKNTPVEVGVVIISSESAPVYSDLPGRVSCPREAEVRARVTGVVQKQYFVEGSEVKEGDILFLIDPAPMQAAYDNAKAALDKAQATLGQSEATAKRYQDLVKIGAVSQQDCDEKTTTVAENRAMVQVDVAALKTAELNLSYTKVTSPISGRIGKGLVTEGALVSSSEMTELALIRQMDPVYFDFTQSNADVLKLRRAIAAGKLSKVGDTETKAILLLEDGSVYEHDGKLLFADISVDESTDMVQLRAEFPNPEKLLLPGSFARIRITRAVNENSVAVPQRAVSRKTDGSATVFVVGESNKIELRTISTGDAVGDKWIVTSGLKEGETVVVEGLQKVRAGQVVTTVPFGGIASTGSAGTNNASKEN
jgi:membrane fusion protein, multidrug efflux system